MAEPHPDPQPLSLWQVLEEEVVSLGGSLPEDYRRIKAVYFARRSEAEQACRDDPSAATDACVAAVAARDLAEREQVKYLFELLHEARRTALCFSGGGIRSATFGLGVLHGLARYSAAPGAATASGLLTEFDYLSTVSGGGYLGGWLSAWRYWHPGGTGGVVKVLSETPLTKLDPEPSALRYLRNYTAYLNPRNSLLSTDTWTLISTTLRNILLNWTVILPLVAAFLLVPRLALAVIGLDVSSLGWLAARDRHVFTLMLFAAFFFLIVPTAYVARVLPSFGDYQGTQRNYFFGVLGPLAISAALLSTYWTWYINSGAPPHDLAYFAAFGAGAHVAGAVVGAILVFRHGFVSRTVHLAVAAGVSFVLWRRFGFWPAALTAPIVCLILFRDYLYIVASAMVAALATGALGGAFTYLVATRLLQPDVVSPLLYTTFGFPSVLAVFGVVTMLLVAATSKFTTEDDREWWARTGAWLLIAVLAWVVFSAAVLYGPALLRRFVAALTAAGGVTGVVASRLGFSGRTSSGRRDEQPAAGGEAGGMSGKLRGLALSLAAPAFVVLLVLLLAIVNDWLLSSIPGWTPERLRASMTGPVRLEVLAIGLLVLPAMALAFLVNINVFSLHGMYRSRLVRAFLGASNPHRRPDPFTGFDPKDNVPMHALGRRKDGVADAAAGAAIERPLHVVNIALNLVKGDNLAWQQRKAESFTVTTLHAGSCRVGYQQTKGYGAEDGMDIGTAITISGAAASPNMGYHSSPVVAMLMALFNARLGWWLANPGRYGSGKWKLAGPRWAVTAWINEAFGLTTDTAGWVYLSDGGHFENLGLYEMVLRRCRLVVVVDASADPRYTLEDLGNAVRKIRVDFGIPIEFPGGLPIRSRLDRTNAHCAVGRIQYRCVDGDRTRSGAKIKDGILVYIKPTLNGNEPPDVSHYASVDVRFPQQPTADQWFDEAQFESYRRLGSHAVDEILGPRGPCSLAYFVLAAARHARKKSAG